jgi:trans-AT polyketide synthase/acyltransferase/oxidoreductase domain-containing protein
MTVFMFPGQGSQKPGMGENLFAKYKEFTDIADSILGYSIEKLCNEDPDNMLGMTQYTQPALFTVNSLIYLDLVEEKGKHPDYTAGHSLGEYSALFASGAFDFADGLKLVKKRGELMSSAKGGGMAAVIGLTDSAISSVLKENNLTAISVANYNSPVQIVITGPETDIIRSQPIFENAGAKMFVPLKVSGAFHSPYMKEAADEFSRFMDQFVFHELKIPVISNINAVPYEQDKIKETLVEQITVPVRWTETIQYLLNKGETDFIEAGPGKVLSGLLKQNLRR